MSIIYTYLFDPQGEPKKESRKQEYLRKMGLSQEKNTSTSDSRDGGLQRTPSTSSFPKCDDRMEDRTRRVTEGIKDDKSALSKKDEESERKVEGKEQNDGSKLKDRREMRESSSSKTKELISKLPFFLHFRKFFLFYYSSCTVSKI